MNSIDIKQLAKILSLNPSTISRALSDHPDISVKTKERVKQAAEEFNYIPNLHAKYFRQKNSGLIALILPEFNMFFTHKMIDGINSVLENSGYSIIIFISNNQLNKEIEITRHCISWHVDGVFLSLSEQTENLDHLQPLKNANIPVVLIDKVIFTDQFVTVTIDDAKTALEATKYLLNQNRKKILGVFGNPKLEISKSRMEGFKTALLAAGHHYSEQNIVCIENLQNMEIELQKSLTHSYDGIFIMSDELLIHAYHFMMKQSFLPDNISMIAISDGVIPHHLFPRVDHILHSGFDLGKKASEELLSYIAHKDKEISHFKIETQIIVFNTVSD
jgi:LacI family transcriptional regulator